MLFDKDFSTETLDKESQKVANVIMRVLASKLPKDWKASGGGCKVFYSPKEWKSRGEQHGDGSVLVVTYDGGDHREFFNYDYESVDSIADMDNALEKAGYMHEPINHWSTAIYKN